MYKEAIKFHKYMFPIFLGICLICFLTGCAAFEQRSMNTVTKRRSTRVIECVDRFLTKDLKATISYDICKDIYKRGE